MSTRLVYVAKHYHVVDDHLDRHGLCACAGNAPSSSADIIMAIKESVEIVVFKESGDWRQNGFSQADSTKGYWVSSQFVTEKE